MKYANCGASVKSSGKVKMNAGGFMKIGDGLQKLDVNKTEDAVKANKGKAVKKKPKLAYSSGGMAEKKRKSKYEEEEEAKGSKKSSVKSKRGELVEASYGKSVRKKKK